MNIQQLRYVVAIASTGTFREAATTLYVSQPSLSVAVKDLEEELGFKIFKRTTSGAVLTRRGTLFFEKAQRLVAHFDTFENQYSLASRPGKQEFSIASQHYDFLPPLMTTFSEAYPEHAEFRIFESTTVQILDEVVDGHSELGIIYLSEQNRDGILRKMAKQGLEYEILSTFQTHIYLRKGHPLAQKTSLTMEDLAGLPSVLFTQEKDEYLYYSENLVDRSDATKVFKVTDRATLNGILERTDAYATGSGFLDSESVNGITVIPLEGAKDNQMIYVKRAEMELSPCAKKFVAVMEAYFEQLENEEL
ncbi:LysR family transcriptional regulator [Streptococcus plurextorum]|uniref:LysR family transcriptional regulator n=1 Tax=Streptococcus plurextorum TaxID=456876 RepID=UPI00041324AE|nr:LysR family transcriptional regulator [Streptococcus plurextorum]